MLHNHSFALFVAIAAAYFSTPGRGADDGSRYAAIWEQTSGPAFIARHGLTSQAYQQEFDTRMKDGFRLMLVNGY